MGERGRERRGGGVQTSALIRRRTGSGRSVCAFGIGTSTLTCAAALLFAPTQEAHVPLNAAVTWVEMLTDEKVGFEV